MLVNTITSTNCTPQTIVIGRRATHDTLQIVFDLAYLIENYGDGTAVLAVKRSQDESAYPAVVIQEDNILTWTVSETDTAYVGSGECQLMWYVDGGLAKTIIYPMVVMRDILSTAEEPPDGYENWIEHLTDLGAETQQNAQNAAQSASEAEQAKDDAVDAKEASEEAARKAAAASVHAPIIQNGFWYIWSDDQYVNTNVRAEGEKGDKGDTGEKGDTGNGIASITKTGTSGLVDTYTVTYTDGTSTTFTVTNGAKGDKGDTGATGNGIASIAKTGTSGNVDTYTITYTNGQTVTFTVTNGAVSSVAGKTGAVVLDSGDIGYDSTETYTSGTAGAALNDLSRHLSDVEENQIPELKNAISQKAPLIINSASGDIASFSDGADSMPIKKFVGTIEPVQDLHGYDYPWPGGGSKNLVDINSPSWRNENITANNGVITSSQPSGQGATRGVGYNVNGLTIGTSYYLSVQVLTNGTGDRISIQLTSGGTGSAQTNYGSTGFIGFTFEATDTTVVFRIRQNANNSWSANKLQLEVGTARTAFVPYENVCPISGWTGANIFGRGKNLFDVSAYTIENSKYVDTDGVIKDSIYNCAVEHVPLPSNVTITLAGLQQNTSGKTRIAQYDAGGNFLQFNEVSANSQRKYKLTITTDPSCAYANISLSRANTSQESNFAGLQIEVGTTATEYEAFHGTTLPINWQTEAGTIYGGTVTLNEDGSADVVADMGYGQVTSQYLSGLSSSYIEYAESTSALGGAPAVTVRNLFTQEGAAGRRQGGIKSLCNAFEILFNSTAYSTSQDRCLFKVDGVTINSVATFISAVQTLEQNGSGLFVAYELATPQTYHISDIGQLYTYLGTNNVWIDTGAITECDYPADTKLYIDGLTAPDEDMIANANIASGKYFVVNNQLYLSTAAIAAGASIVPGTNCTATNLAEALNALNT